MQNRSSTFKQNNRKQELEELQTSLAKQNFNPTNISHIKYISQQLESFASVYRDIRRNDYFTLSPDFVLGVLWAMGYCPLWVALLIAIPLTILAFVYLERNELANQHQFEIHKMLQIFNWCTKKGTVNLELPVVKELIAAIAPLLRYTADYNFPKHRETISQYPLVQFFNDFNHARHLNSYGYRPEQLKQALEGESSSQNAPGSTVQLPADPGYVEMATSALSTAVSSVVWRKR